MYLLLFSLYFLISLVLYFGLSNWIISLCFAPQKYENYFMLDTNSFVFGLFTFTLTSSILRCIASFKPSQICSTE